MLLKRFLLPLSIFLFFFFLYLHNLTSDIYGGDVGDLVTAGYLFGVPHPPGYPLFSLLGFVFSHITSFGSVAFRVGLISVLSASLGLVFFFLTIQKITKRKLIPFLTTLILGTNFLYWFYAEIAEVFALHIFLSILLFYLTISFYESKKNLYLFLFSFVLGVSFTNHQTIVFILPSLFLLLFFSIKKSFFQSWKMLTGCSLLFLLGVSVFFYIPVASSTKPVINWDTVHDISSFFHLILRKDYGTFSAGVFEKASPFQRILTLQNYFKTLFIQLTLPVVIISLFGMFRMFKGNRILAIALLSGFILSGPVFVAYAGFPLYSSFNFGVYERFFLLSYILFIFFFPFGLLFFTSLLKPYFHSSSLLAVQSIFFLIPVLLFSYNFQKTNLSSLRIGDNVGKDLLTVLPTNSLVMLSGDTLLFNTQYIRYATNYRADTKVVNLNGLGVDEYFQNIQRDVAKKNPTIKNQSKLGVKTIEYISQTRPVFSAVELTVDSNYTWLPYGILKKLIRKSDIPSQKDFKMLQDTIWHSYHIPYKNTNDLVLGNLTISEIPTIYSNAFLTNGYYFYSQYHDEKTPLVYFQRAKDIEKTNARVYSILGIYYSTIDFDCAKAKDNFMTSISLNPFEKISYFTLYSLVKPCKFNNNLQKELQVQYEKVFQSDFQKDMIKAGKKK